MPGDGAVLQLACQRVFAQLSRPLRCGWQRRRRVTARPQMVLTVRDPSDAPLNSQSQRLESGDLEDVVNITQQRGPFSDEGTVLNAMRGRTLVDALDARDYLVTLLQVTGAILFWRGIWRSWDAIFGFSAWSEIAAILTGLAVMTSARFLRSNFRASLQPDSASSRRGGSHAYKSFDEDAT